MNAPNNLHSHCGAITDPFPNRADYIDKKSAMYIAEAIAEREEKGVVIPPGKCDVTLMNKPLANDGQDSGPIITKILAFWYVSLFLITHTNMFSSSGRHS